jgi:hypothetical protein
MAKKKALGVKSVNTAVMIVGEGHTEYAFLEYLKALYYERGRNRVVRIYNAHGHGPQGMLDKVKCILKTAAFDVRVSLLDSDIALKPEEHKVVKKLDLQVIFSVPAIEATLLQIAGRVAPEQTHDCKALVARYLPGDPTAEEFYQRHFPREVLDSARPRVAVLDQIVSVITG